ncbi:helix-turn-helix domain-containing protein [Streptomyces sp. Vc74B-19]|uniref:helix-turn-helix domain-containing protein n=1 Tax=unclassified Streptomyces TaxID=2593676 RepID=UPI001BFC73A9|nr:MULTISPECIES: helix-turn-helix domain-containing protein [unclassified Streptomyces]MBT3167581.1 helix-turn-helix domain-containing protein [Streptomyces sp. Vc74B-19]MCO4697022.1 helix-turn-helix domain-containing protein [Streptomyces sp. RO-S4]
MAHPTGKYADFEGLREQAVALRRAGYSLRQIREKLKIYNNDILNQLVKGEPPPAWTRRPNAKDDLRAKARELRLQGWTYDQIQIELGCSRSSVSLWVRDLPKPEPRYTPEEQRQLMNEGLARRRAADEEARRRTRRVAHRETSELTDRELFTAGVALYWAEGAKSKPYDRRERAVFVNSDPGVIQTYLAWLDLLGIDRERLGFRVLIHESADIDAAHAFWAEIVDIDPSAFARPTLKKHNAKTIRKNTGENYRGCLTVTVARSADLYNRIEGWWSGIVAHAQGRLR